MPYLLRIDARRKVLLVAFTGPVTEAAYMNAYEDAAKFVNRNGPCSCIVDFSAADDFDLSAEFARKIGVMRLLFPVGWRRIVVAPQPVIYGTARIVAALREGTGGEVVVTTSLAEALTAFGNVDFTFEEVK